MYRSREVLDIDKRPAVTTVVARSIDSGRRSKPKTTTASRYSYRLQDPIARVKSVSLGEIALPDSLKTFDKYRRTWAYSTPLVTTFPASFSIEEVGESGTTTTASPVLAATFNPVVSISGAFDVSTLHPHGMQWLQDNTASFRSLPRFVNTGLPGKVEISSVSITNATSFITTQDPNQTGAFVYFEPLVITEAVEMLNAMLSSMSTKASYRFELQDTHSIALVQTGDGRRGEKYRARILVTASAPNTWSLFTLLGVTSQRLSGDKKQAVWDLLCIRSVQLPIGHMDALTVAEECTARGSCFFVPSSWTDAQRTVVSSLSATPHVLIPGKYSPGQIITEL
jgi:hypothetical protein